MKKFVSLLVLVAMVACLALSLASCGEPKDDGAEISVYLGYEMYDFDPTDYYVDSNVEALMSLLYEPLFRYSNEGSLEMAAAKSYTVDILEREIVIELRESYWSNNTRVTAADFVYAWCERLLNPNNANPAAALLYDIEGALDAKNGEISPSDVGVHASSTYELTIKYRQGADVDALLTNLASVATSPVRQADVEKTPTYWSKVLTTVTTNGPFKISRYSFLDPDIEGDENEFTLSRNRGYHQPYDKVDYDNVVTPGKLVAFTTPTGAEMQISYQDLVNKTVFYMTEAPLADRIAYKQNAVANDDTSVYSYIFNTEHELFAIPEVRQALSMVIDREAIVAAIAFGKAADGFLPDVSGGNKTQGLIAKNADLAAAEALLETVNLPSNRSFTLTVADNEESLAIAEIVEKAWESLGFRVTVKAVDFVETRIKAESADMEDTVIRDSELQVLTKRASYGNRQFDVIGIDIQTFTTDGFAALAALTSNMNGGGMDFESRTLRTSVSGWVNADYDYLVAMAYKSEGAERAEYLKAAEELLCEELPICPIVYNQNFVYSTADISGIDYDGFGNAILVNVKQKNYQKYLED